MLATFERRRPVYWASIHHPTSIEHYTPIHHPGAVHHPTLVATYDMLQGISPIEVVQHNGEDVENELVVEETPYQKRRAKTRVRRVRFHGPTHHLSNIVSQNIADWQKHKRQLLIICWWKQTPMQEVVMLIFVWRSFHQLFSSSMELNDIICR